MMIMIYINLCTGEVIEDMLDESFISEIDAESNFDTSSFEASVDSDVTENSFNHDTNVTINYSRISF